MLDAIDQHNRNEFVTKVVQNDLYLWTKDSRYCNEESDWAPGIAYYLVKVVKPKTESHCKESSLKNVPHQGGLTSLEDNVCEESRSVDHSDEYNKPVPACSVDLNEADKPLAAGPGGQNKGDELASGSGDQNEDDKPCAAGSGFHNKDKKLAWYGGSDDDTSVDYDTDYDELKPMTWNKKSVCDVIQLAHEPHPPRDYQKDYSPFCQVSVDTMSETLYFTHILEDSQADIYGEKRKTFSESKDTWQRYHVYQVLTFNTLDNTWTEKDMQLIKFPKIKYGFRMGRQLSLETELFDAMPCKRLVWGEENDGKERIQQSTDRNASVDIINAESGYEEKAVKFDTLLEASVANDLDSSTKSWGPETCIGAEYYAKTASPYCTYVWTLKPEEGEWQLMTLLPFSLDKFPYFQTGEMSCDLLKTLPNSCFEDFSEIIGQSEVACFATRKSLADLSSTKDVLSRKVYGKHWAKCWAETFTSEGD